MLAELVLPGLSMPSGPSRRPESASAYRQAGPASDEACRLDEPSPARPAPDPRRRGVCEQWLLVPDIQRGGGGGQSVEWFFDTIDHGWLIKFIEHRIADRRVLRLIQKWLRAGVMEQGKRMPTEVGSPQGATVSPLLANICLHYALDLWV